MSKHNSVPTVKIQTEPSKGNPSGVVIINESDYDPEVHTLFVEGTEEESELAGTGEGTNLTPESGSDDVVKKPWEN